MGIRTRLPISSTLFSGSIAELLHPPASQIPFLDGLRSIAVMLVISAHFSGDFVAGHGPNFYSQLPFVNNGWVGVDLFFVLSGFFIGGQLWKELQGSETVNVGRFVMRRGLRVWPLFYFMFLCLFLFQKGAAASEYGWSDLIFITNFHNRGLVYGSWSLCMEEQFYLVAPLTLFFCARHVRSIRVYRPWLWGLLLFVPLLRAAVWMHVTGNFFLHNQALLVKLYLNPFTHGDGLIMGMIISNLRVTREKPAAKFATPGVLIAVAAALFIGLAELQKEIFLFTVLALFFGSLVWLGVERRPAIFNSRFFYWISRLSYGMYLNHEYLCPWMIRVLLPALPFTTRLPALANFIGVVLLGVFSTAIAIVTFCFVEYPFLQMRNALLRRTPKDPASFRESVTPAVLSGLRAPDSASTE
jgi:peptidoglycan/LPS O-acetylase OafA/YrhL